MHLGTWAALQSRICSWEQHRPQAELVCAKAGCLARFIRRHGRGPHQAEDIAAHGVAWRGMACSRGCLQVEDDGAFALPSDGSNACGVLWGEMTTYVPVPPAYVGATVRGRGTRGQPANLSLPEGISTADREWWPLVDGLTRLESPSEPDSEGLEAFAVGNVMLYEPPVEPMGFDCYVIIGGCEWSQRACGRPSAPPLAACVPACVHGMMAAQAGWE